MARRIESKPSRTADIVCGCRAISYLETNKLYKSEDWIAPKLLPRKIQLLIKIPIARYLLTKILGGRGIYEWIIARTRYIDDVFMQVQNEGFLQVLIFGAGFDSRGIRFKDQLKDTKIFELDVATTQAIKQNQFKKRGIQIPGNLNFVPINFEKDSIIERLNKSGFQYSVKTLVILEGVLQYLLPEAAYKTLDIIKTIIGSGSWIVFDYAHASALKIDHASNDNIKLMNKLDKYGESWQFGLEENEVEALLNRYGFELIDRKGSGELENDNFKLDNGMIKGKVNKTQSIIKGIKRA
jgi:methyltransferase (TIGR00027 family)